MMKGETKACSDPLIEEVRNRRRELFERHGRDLRKLIAAIREREARHPQKVGSPVKRPRSR